jgi:hypothetical protein
MDNNNQNNNQNNGNGSQQLFITQDMVLAGAIKQRHLAPSPVQVGDLYYGNGGNFLNLPIGTSNQFLTVVNGIPAWVTYVPPVTTPVWQTYVPTTGSFTVGNGTLLGNYATFGKTCWFNCSLTWGSTTSISVGQMSFGSLPKTIQANTPAAFSVLLHDAGSNVYAGVTGTNYLTPDVVLCQICGSAGIFSNTSPFTWATGDQIIIAGVYETQ